jgi:hypothetical protein
MAPMNKPEWFQLAESDGGLPRRNVKRGFRALALSVPLMAIGIGVVVAQTSNESPAIAESTSVAATQSPLASSSPIAPSVVASSPASTKAVQTIQPAIAKPPTGGGDDDENENEGGNKRGDHREGGEHQESGEGD